MKAKFLMVVLFAATCFSTISAQELTYGVKAGLNISTLSGSDVSDLNSTFGFNLGVTAAYSLNDKSSVSAEILFSQQGAKETESETYSDVKYEEMYKLKFNYINIPILYNYYVTDRIAIKAGVQPGLLISGKEIYEITYGDESENQSESIDKDYYNSIDFSVPVGISYNVTNNIVVDARYNIGVSSIIENSSVNNSVFAVSVGFNF